MFPSPETEPASASREIIECLLGGLRRITFSLRMGIFSFGGTRGIPVLRAVHI